MKNWLKERKSILKLIVSLVVFLVFCSLSTISIQWLSDKFQPHYPEAKGWVEVGGGGGFKSATSRVNHFIVNSNLWKVVWQSDYPDPLVTSENFNVDISRAGSSDIVCSISSKVEVDKPVTNHGETICIGSGTYDIEVGAFNKWQVTIYEWDWWPNGWVKVKNVNGETGSMSKAYGFTVHTNTWKVVWMSDEPIAGPASYDMEIYSFDKGDNVCGVNTVVDADKPGTERGEVICHGSGRYDIVIDTFGNFQYTVYEWRS